MTTEAHIAGNVIADGLAAGGARMHFIIPMTLIMADDKAELTAIVQTHLITSWSSWITYTKGHAIDVEAEAFLMHATMHNSKGMIQDDELHPGPLDGNIDHDSERDGLLTTQDVQGNQQQVDEGDNFDDFDLIDLDGNVLTRDPTTPSASHK